MPIRKHFWDLDKLIGLSVLALCLLLLIVLSVVSFPDVTPTQRPVPDTVDATETSMLPEPEEPEQIAEPVVMMPGKSIATRVIYGQEVEATFQAKVIRIVDGDTLELLLNDETTPNCRLASIDCPERKQPFSRRAKEALGELCHGKTVEVLQIDTDRYRLPIVFVVADGINVNAEMIRRGLAWHYVKYSDSEALSELQNKAQEAKLGLWADIEPVAPWRWRKRRAASVPEPSIGGTQF